MIVGIGVDMIEIGRVIHACEREHFLKKIFSEREIQQMDAGKRRAASDFAGKEAVVKALGTGFFGVEAIEIEILRRENGSPYVVLHGGAARKAEELCIRDWQISITNTKELATAFVIASA
ncbi:MAG: holo-ACP synthase [Eubacterium sp.]|jgi:phosphopantethiene--protein transferase domain|nr:holo-ACP synthase [Eubacterium sp.]